ncbi:hypothetical protein [Anthocerotibacter panamensis]|uniref:hypothetical protein n=1 Tax=Anthocerotibacter panamensis TaxID=2857077 RepID=UPI001C407345|nr:hypothetical protein [Anthocerotibacter panamensis]
MASQSNRLSMFLGAALFVALVILLLLSQTPKRDTGSTPRATSEQSSTAVTPSAGSTVPSAAEPPPSQVPAGAVTPTPAVLAQLHGEEITSSVPVADGYVVQTTFGATWYLRGAEIERLTPDVKLRLDYELFSGGERALNRSAKKP